MLSGICRTTVAIELNWASDGIMMGNVVPLTAVTNTVILDTTDRYQVVGLPRDIVRHPKPWFLSDGVGPARRGAFLPLGGVSVMLERMLLLDRDLVGQQ